MRDCTTWMFHYVRPVDEKSQFPYLKGFSLSDFQMFLDLVSREGYVINPQTYLDSILHHRSFPPHANLLTFDDGLIDHFQWVFPELKKRNLSAFFFVSSGSIQGNALLGVHKIHALSGLMGYDRFREKFLQAFESQTTKSFEEKLMDPRSRVAYPYDDEVTAGFKYVLNYLLDPGDVERTLDRIIADSLNEASLAREFYLSASHIRLMAEDGMFFGYHGHTHQPFSRLNINALEEELKQNQKLLNPLLPSSPYCLSYPYGDASSVSGLDTTILQKWGIKVAFMAENYSDQKEYYYLPRVDCAEWKNLVGV